MIVINKRSAPNTAMSEFSVAPYEWGGSFGGYWTPAGSSQYHGAVQVTVNGMPPVPGQTGPGINVIANSEEELRALHAWVVAKLSVA